MTSSLAELDWPSLSAQLTREGYVVLRELLGRGHARSLADTLLPLGPAPSPSRRSLSDAELPAPLDTWRHALYARLAPLGNAWNEALGDAYRFPPTLPDFLERNRAAGQQRALSLVHRLRGSEHAPLHRRAEGEHVFPVQLVALLSEPGEDFAGGELVMTERRPRMQSRPIVIPLALGDLALVATARRPVQGARGTYAVDTKHGVSRVRSGQRVGLEVFFHHAPA